jgi:hypothetical protein
MDVDRSGHELLVSAWPEPPFATHAAITADVHDGMEALAPVGTTIEMRPNRAGEGERRSLYGFRLHFTGRGLYLG